MRIRPEREAQFNSLPKIFPPSPRIGVDWDETPFAVCFYTDETSKEWTDVVTVQGHWFRLEGSELWGRSTKDKQWYPCGERSTWTGKLYPLL